MVCVITGFPEVRGPVCFNCPQSLTPNSCESIRVCETDEVEMLKLGIVTKSTQEHKSKQFHTAYIETTSFCAF